MIVLRTIAIKPRTCQQSALDTSCTDEIAIACEDGSYLLDFQHAEVKKAEAMSHRLSKMLASEETKVFWKRNEVIVDHSFRKKLNGINLQKKIDRTLRPDNHCFRGIRTVKWSPAYADQMSRCVLSMLSLDHRLTIASRGVTIASWREVVDLSDEFLRYCQSSDFRLLEECRAAGARLGQEATKRYAVAAVDVAWHPGLLGNQSSSASNSGQYTYLASVMKSGHLVMWKTFLPVAVSSWSVERVVLPLHEIPTAVCWCRVQTKHELKDFAVVGYVEGEIFAVNLKSGDVTPLWKERDRLSITTLCWCHEEMVLLAGKGPFVLSMKLSVTSDERVKVQHSVSPPLVDSSFVSAISYSKNKYGPLVSLGNGSVMLGKQDTPSSFKYEEIYSATDRGRWKCDGAALTRNGVFVYVLQSCIDYLHQSQIKAGCELLVLSSMSAEDILAIISEVSSGRLTDITDALIYTQYLVNKDEADWPAALKSLIAPANMSQRHMESWPLVQLKLRRFLLRLATSFPPEKEDYAKLSHEVELEILRRHLGSALKLYLSDHASSPPTEQELLVLTIACQVLDGSSSPYQKTLKAVCKILPGVMERKARGALTERCAICGKDVAFTLGTSASCSSGHTFGRCCQTMLLCSEVPYRRCQWCGQLATRRPQDRSQDRSQDDSGRDTPPADPTGRPQGGWWSQLVTHNCTFCDGQLL